MLSVQWYGYVARCMRECLTLSFLRLVLYFVWFFLLVLCLLRIWCKRLSTRLFRISYSREESQINRGKITARSTNDDQYRGTNCHEIAACFGTQFWNRAKHRFRNRTKFMRNLEKRHFLTSWPVPDPDLDIKSGGGGGGGGGLPKIFFPALRASVWSKNKGGGLSPGPATDDYALPWLFLRNELGFA